MYIYVYVEYNIIKCVFINISNVAYVGSGQCSTKAYKNIAQDLSLYGWNDISWY